jgi:hypothetical protein
VNPVTEPGAPFRNQQSDRPLEAGGDCEEILRARSRFICVLSVEAVVPRAAGSPVVNTNKSIRELSLR